MGSSPRQNSYTDNWLPDFIKNYCGERNDEDSQSTNRLIDNGINNVINEEITIDDLQLALNHKKNTSSGYDGFTYKMIQELPHNALLYLSTLMNESVKNCKIPPSWKQHRVVPILKPEKNPDQWTSYRPITLLSCVGKTLEMILKNRIEWFVENKKLLSSTQFGFRKGKGVHDCLNIFKTDIQLSLSKNEYLFAIFVDIKGAYDNINLAILESKIIELGIPLTTAKWITKYFKNRIIFINNIHHT